MTEIVMQLNFAGQANEIIPRIGRLYAPNSTLSQIATAGFLTQYLKSQGVGLLATDFIAAVGSNGHQWYKPVFGANGVCTLTVLP